MKAKRKRIKRPTCEAQTEFCSGEMLARYGVNKSEKENKTFMLCGACVALLRRMGHKIKPV